MSKNTSAYLVTKPLQYLNCTNIEDENESRICLLCDHFADSKNFFRIISKEDTYFTDFKFFKNYICAIWFMIKKSRNINRIYLDSDYGLLRRLLLSFIPFAEFYVYEEGNGSYVYTRESDSIHNKIRVTVDSILGHENYLGGWHRVTGVYVYDHELFKKRIKLKDYIVLRKFKSDYFYKLLFQSSVLNILAEDIDFDLFKNKKILIYLTDWTISPSIVSKIESYPDYLKILKVHPNIKDDTSYYEKMFDYVVPQNLVAEYFLMKIFDVADCVHIIHKDSSVIFYLESIIQDKRNITQELI